MLCTFRVEDTSRRVSYRQEMGDRLRLWEDQCEPVALKRAKAREKVLIRA